MRVADIGEFGLIELLSRVVKQSQAKNTPAWQNLILGIGDDAAAWRNDGKVTLATTDCLIQDVHFTLGTTTWHELGWKALAVNLSDIAAMGGRPRYALVTLGLPGDTEVEDVTALYQGMMDLGQKFGVAIAGGNTSAAVKVFISLSVIGIAGKHLLTRSAAKSGDQIVVIGYLGAAAAGFRLISRQQPPTPEDVALRQAFLKPYPRLVEAELMVAQGVKTAIDISDGLLADLGHICQASQVGARVELEQVPVHPMARKLFGAEALDLALSGGEDYELLFSASSKIIRNIQSKGDTPLTVIGEVTGEHPGQVELVDKEGKIVKLHKTGWEHFAPKQT